MIDGLPYGGNYGGGRKRGGSARPEPDGRTARNGGAGAVEGVHAEPAEKKMEAQRCSARGEAALLFHAPQFARLERVVEPSARETSLRLHFLLCASA